MASPTVNGATFTPDPVTPGQPFTVKVDGYDADLANPSVVLPAQVLLPDGRVARGNLTTPSEDLTFTATPDDAVSPPLNADMVDETLFHGTAPGNAGQLVYQVGIVDMDGNSDAQLVVSKPQPVKPPIPPIPPSGPGRFVLDLSQTKFNPATGRDQIVIGGGFGTPGTNSTEFGSADIEALIHNGKARARIHYVYGGGINPSTDRSVNLEVPFQQQPGEKVHYKAEYIVEGVPEVSIRKLLYFMRMNTSGGAQNGTHFVIFEEKNKLYATLPNPAFYNAGATLKLLRYDLGSLPAGANRGQEFELDVEMRLNTLVGVNDGELVVTVNGSQIFARNDLLTGKIDNSVPQGTPFAPITLWKFGQQASATTRGVPFDEWRFISNGLLIEKV